MKQISFLLFLSFFISASVLVAQNEYSTTSKKAIKHFEKAKISFREREYEKAFDYIEKALKVDKNFIEPYLLLAEIYYDKHLYDKEIEAYKSIVEINPNYRPEIWFYKALTEYKIGRYDDSVESFTKYFETEPENYLQTIHYFDRARFSAQAVAKPLDVEFEALSDSVNSPFDEYRVSLTADDSIMIFTRLLPLTPDAQPQEDIYLSRSHNSTWSLAKAAGSILNTADNEGAQTISADGISIIFTACNRPNSFGSCDLYFTFKTHKGWAPVKNLGKPISSPYWESQPSLSADGRTLYFVSNRPGGFGGQDIWVSKLDAKGYWSNPLNLGSKINTGGNEISPFIHLDNQTLYFASDSLIGLGGYDLFMARRENDNSWQTPQNLGFPINSHNDEISLVIDTKGAWAYFSADKVLGKGKDIYRFKVPEPIKPQTVTYMKGIVYDAETNERLQANFELFDLKKQKLEISSYSSFGTGEFLLCLNCNFNYALNVSKSGYLFFSQNFNLLENYSSHQPFLMNIPLQPIKAGKKFVLENVFFETDSYELKAESFTELNKLIDFLTNNKTIRIEIGGHTDNVGGEAYNMRLSENRAKTVYNYLINKGIAANRLTFAGYGYFQALDTNDTETGRARNRRTEVKIL